MFWYDEGTLTLAGGLAIPIISPWYSYMEVDLHSLNFHLQNGAHHCMYVIKQKHGEHKSHTKFTWCKGQRRDRLGTNSELTVSDFLFIICA